ncbi:signal peptidase I [Patescibacteria group bacterium]|jgi:signal peptidase I|nr:signal peptidase I [Patescibacteria group bacterium]
MPLKWFGRRPATETLPETPKAKTVALVLEMIQVLAVSLAIIIPVRWFLIQPFYVQGASMEPNFFDHEYLIIDELSYRLGNPQRGDIVVFHYPNDPKQFFIKRVIGLPGETVEISDGKIRIYNVPHPNGILLDETAYLDQDFTAASQTVTLKADQFYLLGDNRSSSLDSRFFGPVSRKHIVGRVWVRGYPVDRWRYFDQQTYPNF